MGSTSLFYFLSKVSLLIFFIGAFSLSLFEISNLGTNLNQILIIASAIAGFVIVNLTYHLSKNQLKFFNIIFLPILSITIILLIQKNELEIINSVNYFDISNETINKILLSFVYFLPSFIIIHIHWNIRWFKGKKLDSKIPEVVITFFHILILIIPAMLLLSRVFSLDLTAILATSGVFVAVLGLAIQPNLNNIFSGLFVSLERPFQPNEWITIGDKTGVVLDVNWRSTKIRTFENVEITIPNAKVAQSIIQNFNRPDKVFMSEGFHIFNTLSFHPQHDPKYITSLLENALSKVVPVDGRKTLDLQWVKFIEVNEYGLKFAVAFDCTNRLLKNSQQNVVLTEIHQVLAHAGISMSAGRLTSFMEKDAGLSALNDIIRKKSDFDITLKDIINPYSESVKNKALLKKVPIFNCLNDEEQTSLSLECERRFYKAENLICKQGSLGESLFIIVDGVVSIDKSDGKGRSIHIAKLGVGDFFGEMSLMTGEPRTASISTLKNTVVLEINKKIIKTLFGNNKAFYDNVALVFAKRKLKMDELEKLEINSDEYLGNIFKKFKQAIYNFLS